MVDGIEERLIGSGSWPGRGNGRSGPGVQGIFSYPQVFDEHPSTLLDLKPGEAIQSRMCLAGPDYWEWFEARVTVRWIKGMKPRDDVQAS